METLCHQSGSVARQSEQTLMLGNVLPWKPKRFPQAQTLNSRLSRTEPQSVRVQPALRSSVVFSSLTLQYPKPQYFCFFWFELLVVRTILTCRGGTHLTFNPLTFKRPDGRKTVHSSVCLTTMNTHTLNIYSESTCMVDTRVFCFS